MTARDVVVLYDKQCPACDIYCHLVRICGLVWTLVLQDARDAGPLLEEVRARGLDGEV